jgi:signal transduction histidine kinase
MNEHDEWSVIVRGDRIVDHVEGGAPGEWVGRPVDELPGAPRELTLAARRLLELPPSRSGFRRSHVTLHPGSRTVGCELVLLEALPMRRALVQTSELVLRTLDTFLAQARSSAVDIQLEKAPDLPPVVEADGEKLAWALATLVGNALRAFDDEPARNRPAHVLLFARYDAEANEVVFAVKDTGRGMSAARAKALFEQDPTTGRSAGLALVMVRDVMIAHRGRIEVQSRVGHGTTISLHLPR